MLVKDKEVIRIVHTIIKRDTRHPSDSYSFDDVYEEVEDGEVVYKLDYTVDYGDGKYEEYWGVVDKAEILDFIKAERNKKLNNILNEDNQLD